MALKSSYGSRLTGIPELCVFLSLYRRSVASFVVVCGALRASQSVGALFIQDHSGGRGQEVFVGQAGAGIHNSCHYHNRFELDNTYCRHTLYLGMAESTAILSS